MYTLCGMASLEERKDKIRRFVKLMAEGHTIASASSLVGRSLDWGKQMNRRKDIKRRVELAKEQMIGKVRASMYKAAVDGEERETVTDSVKDGVTIKKEKLPPNVHAQKYLLDRYDKDDKGSQVSRLHGVPIEKVLIAVQNNYLLPDDKKKEVLEIGGKPHNPFFEDYDRQTKQFLEPEMKDSEYVSLLLEEGIDGEEE